MAKTTGRNYTGLVFNIQRYCTHDGPGIRTVVFLKGCPLKCYWCQNPESQRPQPEVLLDKSKCTLCGECALACPHGAAYLAEKSSEIRRELCQGCGTCALACPNSARQLMGRKMTVEAVLREILKDRKFYENSGGGVTLSGGEPTAQPAFATELLRRCQELGLHTAIETCGFVRWPVLNRLLKHVNLVLYDIKHLDPRQHHIGTGASNDLILENARRTAQRVSLVIRVPVILGFNDSPADIEAIGEFARAKLGPLPVELLPYNKMGEVKYDRLGRPYEPLATIKEEEMSCLEAIAGVPSKA